MLTIRTDDGGTWFRPGETLRGTVSWHLEEDDEAAQLWEHVSPQTPFWFTIAASSTSAITRSCW